jgi:hypothetical protein
MVRLFLQLRRSPGNLRRVSPDQATDGPYRCPIGDCGRCVHVDVRPVRPPGGLAVRSPPAKDPGVGRVDRMVAGHSVDSGLPHLRSTGAVPRSQRIRRSGLSARLDVSDRRLSRSGHTFSRHVRSSVKRVCRLDRRRCDFRPRRPVLWLAMELHPLRMLRVANFT